MPPEDEIRDPRAFRWVESGVSGLARPREWDATAIAEVAGSAAPNEVEIDFRVLGDGSVIGDVTPGVLARADEATSGSTPRTRRAPYARTRPNGWWERFASSRELVELPAEIDAVSLEAAVPPEGETMYLVDGEILAEAPNGVDGGGPRASSSSSAQSAFRLSSRVPIGWRTVAGR